MVDLVSGAGGQRVSEERSALGLFASNSVIEHVVRGVCGAGLIALALWLLRAPDLPRGGGAVVALGGAVVLLRGCPMCWTMGLIETISRSARKTGTTGKTRTALG
jgi:hypothetical protein